MARWLAPGWLASCPVSQLAKKNISRGLSLEPDARLVGFRRDNVVRTTHMRCTQVVQLRNACLTSVRLRCIRGRGPGGLVWTQVNTRGVSRRGAGSHPCPGRCRPRFPADSLQRRISQSLKREFVMKSFALRVAGFVLFALFSLQALPHGLVQDPPSRNWFCGAVTKPDHVANGTAQYPVCGNAFNAAGVSPNDGYSFMSVLTHTTGRLGVGPRSNVCGFNSETWNGRATVWDQAIDWPTVPMTAGTRTFLWNISWGPHFSDTVDFRYWITKPDFV